MCVGGATHVEGFRGGDCSSSVKGVFYEREFTGTLKKHLQIRLEWEGFSVCGWSYACGRGLGAGIVLPL